MQHILGTFRAYKVLKLFQVIDFSSHECVKTMVGVRASAANLIELVKKSRGEESASEDSLAASTEVTDMSVDAS